LPGERKSVAKHDETDKLLPPEVRDLLEQYLREATALRDQGQRKDDDIRREADLKVAAAQQEAERQVQAIRDASGRAAAAALEAARRELMVRRAELIEELDEMREALARSGQTGRADAVARIMQELQAEADGNVQPAPTNLEAYRDRIGESFLFSVTASTAGPLWGTDVYTTDSAPAKAVVHAGLLRPGESGLVRVTIVERLPNYKGSTRHGVSSSAWHDPWHGAYRVEAAF
jgi:hypothetical protein